MNKKDTTTNTLIHKEPDNVQEALDDSRRLQAMKEEYDALIKNNTWTLVPRQAGHDVADNKWSDQPDCLQEGQPNNESNYEQPMKEATSQVEEE
ncbi:hypothetical protein WN943_015481 [Citrus x changshan-huyou]